MESSIKTKIVSNKNIKGNYYSAIFKANFIARNCLPGQFVNIRVSENDVPLLRRPFGIHRVNGLGFEVLYEVLGEGTKILAQKKPGEYLDIIGPLGNGFTYPLSPIPYPLPVLVAGGMGVAPLFFLAERLVHGQQSTVSRKPLVLIGAKTKSQLLCEKEFQDLGCDVKIATDDGSCGYKGYITDLLEEALSTVDCGLSTVYACGPQPMLKEVSKVSCKYNISVQVSLESHMACGIGACLGCVVRTKNPTCPAGRQEQRAKNGFIYARVCKEGPVFNAQEIEW